MKKNVAVIFGGYSGESAISEQSAATVIRCLSSHYEVYPVRITKEKWVVEKDGHHWPVDKNDFSYLAGKSKISFDVIFNAIHGTPAEDGKLPAYFELIGLPYTGPSSFSAALTMNKYLTNAILREHGVRVAKSKLIKSHEKNYASVVVKELQLPVFVKPNNSGSSLGVSKVKEYSHLPEAIEMALRHSDEVIIEEAIKGREFSCGVYVWQEKVFALPVTEIISHNEFFDYAAKYQNQSDEITPAHIDEQWKNSIQDTAVKVFHLLNLKSFARVDFIVTEQGEPYVLEVNTVPGLSDKSIIPQQLKAAHIPLDQFFCQMIENELRGRR